MKKFLKEFRITFLVELLLAILIFSLKASGILNLELTQNLVNLFWLTLVVFVIGCLFAYRLFKQYEISMRHSKIVRKILLDYSSWTVSTIRTYETNNGVKMSLDKPLQEQLKIAYNTQFKNQFRSELHKVYPKKTAPQIEKLMTDFLSD